MVNFAELLKKSIKRQTLEPTLQVRQRIYEETRSKIKSRLVEMGAPELLRRSYLLKLEAAICEVEASYVMVPGFFDHKNDSANRRFSYNAPLPDYLDQYSDGGSALKNFRTFSAKPARIMENQSRVEPRQAFSFEEEDNVFALGNGGRGRRQVHSEEPFDLDFEDLRFNGDRAGSPDRNNQINRAKPGHSGSDFDEGYTNLLDEGLGEFFNEISNNKEFVDQNGFVDQTGRQKKKVNEIRSEVVPLDLLRQERKNRIKRMMTENGFVDDAKNRTRVENNQSTKQRAVFASRDKKGIEETSISAGQSEAQLPKQNSFVSAGKAAQRMTAIRERSISEKDIAEKDSVGKDMNTRNSEGLNEVAGVFGFAGDERRLSRASGIDDYPLYIDTPAYPVSAGILSGKNAFDAIGGMPARMERRPFDAFNGETVNNKTVHREHAKIAGFKTETVVMASTTPFSKGGLKPESFFGAPNGQAGTNSFESGLIPTEANPVNMPVHEGNRGSANRIVSAENAVNKVSTAQAFERDKRGEAQKADIIPETQTDFLSEKTFPDGTPGLINKISGEEKETRDGTSSFSTRQQNANRKREVVAEHSIITSVDSGTTLIDEESDISTSSVPDISGKGVDEQKKEFLNGGLGKGSQKEGTGDIADTFEQKRTEFFNRLGYKDSNRPEQDLFPPISSFDHKDKGKTISRLLSWRYCQNGIARMLAGRSGTVGIFFILALVFCAYFLGRSGPSVPLSEQQPQNIATRDDKAGNNADWAQMTAADRKKPNDNAKNLSRKNDNARANQKSTPDNLAKKITDEKLGEPQKSSGQKVKLDNVQTNVSGKPHEAPSQIDRKTDVRLASLPVSVMRPVLEETPSENVTVEPAVSVKNKPENPSPATESARVEKTEPGLLLVNDKKGSELKMQSTVTWSLKAPRSAENPLDETALVADFKTDDGKLGARMSIRKNYRDNLGATHLIDLSFSEADGFDSGVVVDVKGFYYGDKANVLTKQASTIVADLYENNFVASLRDDKENFENNRDFLNSSAVIGFQTVFTDGKTALFMLNKGTDENQLFDTFNAPTTH